MTTRERFAPDWKEVEHCVKRIIDTLAGDEQRLVRAFQDASNLHASTKSVTDVTNHLHGIVMLADIPWVLYDTISHVMHGCPRTLREALVRASAMSTARGEFERVRMALDGRWQVAWIIDETADPEDRFVGLDWYLPTERDRAPIVPLTIVDYMAACAALLRFNLVLPTTALLLITLESVLWHHLKERGHVRSTDRVTYADVSWRFRVVGNQLVVDIDGADRTLTELRTHAQGRYSKGNATLRRMSETDGRATLQLNVDAVVAEHLASQVESMRESAGDQGLAEAIQRSRKSGALASVPVQLDETLFRLRNTLIHLPPDGSVVPPIANPAGKPIVSLDSLREDRRFATQLMYLVTRITNDVYGSRTE